MTERQRDFLLLLMQPPVALIKFQHSIKSISCFDLINDTCALLLTACPDALFYCGAAVLSWQ